MIRFNLIGSWSRTRSLANAECPELRICRAELVECFRTIGGREPKQARGLVFISNAQFKFAAVKIDLAHSQPQSLDVSSGRERTQARLLSRLKATLFDIGFSWDTLMPRIDS